MASESSAANKSRKVYARPGVMGAYADGLAEGFRITLRLFLGEACAGAPPFTGPRTPELEKWARDALERGKDVAPAEAVQEVIRGR